jgi:hypothetical protein
MILFSIISLMNNTFGGVLVSSVLISVSSSMVALSLSRPSSLILALLILLLARFADARDALGVLTTECLLPFDLDLLPAIVT